MMDGYGIGKKARNSEEMWDFKESTPEQAPLGCETTARAKHVEELTSNNTTQNLQVLNGKSINLFQN